MELKYILKGFIITFLILSLILFITSFLSINSIGLIESFNNTQSNSLIVNTGSDFCESHRGSSGTLEQSCGKLTENNCNSTSCCVWSSNNKCLAGNAKGPTFNSESNGKTKEIDYYYFEGKCYGKNCPTVV